MAVVSDTDIDAWWAGILRRDMDGKESLLQCVMCGVGLDPRKGCRAMLAWWERPQSHDRRGEVFAFGLYHHGSYRDGVCCYAAEYPGVLLDIHAESAIGMNRAMARLHGIVDTYPRWNVSALRRLVMTITLLSGMKRAK